MELEHCDNHSDVETKTTEGSEPGAGQAALTTPFASEGLEQLRDSHC